MLLDGQLNRERNPFFSFILNVVYHFEVMRTLWIDINYGMHLWGEWHGQTSSQKRISLPLPNQSLAQVLPESLSVPNNTFLDAEYFRGGLVNPFLSLERYLAAKYEHHGFFFSFGNLHSHFIRRACKVEGAADEELVCDRTNLPFRFDSPVSRFDSWLLCLLTFTLFCIGIRFPVFNQAWLSVLTALTVLE